MTENYYTERRDYSFETLPLGYRLKTFVCNSVKGAYESARKLVRAVITRRGKQDRLDNKLTSK